MKKNYSIVTALIYGVISFIFVSQIPRSREEGFFLSANKDGQYQINEKIDGRLSIQASQKTENLIYVHVKWSLTKLDVTVGLIAGLITAGLSLRQSRKEEQVNYSILKAKQHPLYPRFIQEDPERQFLEDRSIIREFSSWLKAQNESSE